MFPHLKPPVLSSRPVSRPDVIFGFILSLSLSGTLILSGVSTAEFFISGISDSR